MGKVVRLPDTEPIVVRASQLGDFRHCPLKEFWGWRESGGWFDPGRDRSGARGRGTEWHAILQIHYSFIQEDQRAGRTPDLDEIHDAVWDYIADWIDNEEDAELLRWMYDGYVELYGFDPNWEVLSVEQTLRVPFQDEDGEPLRVPDPDRRGITRPVLYEWTTDLLAKVRDLRGTFVIDHKSTSAMLGRVDIDLSDQFGLYALAWERLGKPVRGQLINQATTKRLKRAQALSERYDRKTSIRTPAELREIELDAVATIRAMYSEQNLRHPYSAPDPRTCSWKCDFKELHLQWRREKNKTPERFARVARARGLRPGNTHGR